mmetsp:Transcript_15477/g.18772  ORF Transcript_15477/g.18772 Transcript_15477/m.18772 type:complete len:340 (+) Transcript_15477:89-1108(+)
MQGPGTALFRTEDMHNYSVEFSPFRDGLLAIGASQYFGIVGNGRQYIVQKDPATGGMQLLRFFETNDAIYDCSWSELNQNQLVSACGDGSVKLWDMQTKDGFPIQNYHEHMQEVSSVDWNLVSKRSFLTSSHDGTIKLWDPMSPRSLCTYQEHTQTLYNAIWSPTHPTSFISCSGDGTVKIWDTNQPTSAATIPAHRGEVLAVDWNKYDPFKFVTGGATTDPKVKVWDLRQPQIPIEMAGHRFGIRRIKCSPHDEFTIASCSYDMSVCIWRTNREDALSMPYEHHSEFVFGIDWNLFRPGEIVSSSWDEHVCVFNVNAPPPPRIPPPPRKPGMAPPPLR